MESSEHRKLRRKALVQITKMRSKQDVLLTIAAEYLADSTAPDIDDVVRLIGSFSEMVLDCEEKGGAVMCHLRCTAEQGSRLMMFAQIGVAQVMLESAEADMDGIIEFQDYDGR